MSLETILSPYNISNAYRKMHILVHEHKTNLIRPVVRDIAPGPFLAPKWPFLAKIGSVIDFQRCGHHFSESS